MAVTIDAGDVNNVHYANKQPVGLRLALWALARVYDKDIVYSGPLYQSMKVEGNKIRVKFRNVGGGLVAGDIARRPSLAAASGGALKQFIIAGKDRQFVPAEAKIDGDSVWSGATRLPPPSPSATPGCATPKAAIYTIKKDCPPRHSAPTIGPGRRKNTNGGRHGRMAYGACTIRKSDHEE